MKNFINNFFRLVCAFSFISVGIFFTGIVEYGVNIHTCGGFILSVCLAVLSGIIVVKNLKDYTDEDVSSVDDSVEE